MLFGGGKDTTWKSQTLLNNLTIKTCQENKHGAVEINTETHSFSRTSLHFPPCLIALPLPFKQHCEFMWLEKHKQEKKVELWVDICLSYLNMFMWNYHEYHVMNALYLLSVMFEMQPFYNRMW